MRRARRLDNPKHRIQFGESLPIEVAVKLNGLAPGDVCVELLLSRRLGGTPPVKHNHEFSTVAPKCAAVTITYNVTRPCAPQAAGAA